jgi:hypothetical protein
MRGASWGSSTRCPRPGGRSRLWAVETSRGQRGGAPFGAAVVGAREQRRSSTFLACGRGPGPRRRLPRRRVQHRCPGCSCLIAYPRPGDEARPRRARSQRRRARRAAASACPSPGSPHRSNPGPIGRLRDALLLSLFPALERALDLNSQGRPHPGGPLPETRRHPPCCGPQAPGHLP